MSIISLCFTFFYIGLFTIGGGVVAITLMQQTIVARGLISTEQFYNMVAISESTPGPIGINMATYIGYNLYGIPGAILTSIFEALPSIIIILIIARFLQKFHENPFVKGSLAFLRPITTGMILVPAVQIFLFTLVKIPGELNTLLTLAGWKDLFEWVCLAFYALCTFLILKFKVHPIIIIVLGAVFGVLYF
ncbi:MAG: chromate transporter [Treponema sp.]|nr:chromate transporter [Treponema sp.]